MVLCIFWKKFFLRQMVQLGCKSAQLFCTLFLMRILLGFSQNAMYWRAWFRSFRCSLCPPGFYPCMLIVVFSYLFVFIFAVFCWEAKDGNHAHIVVLIKLVPTSSAFTVFSSQGSYYLALPANKEFSGLLYYLLIHCGSKHNFLLQSVDGSQWLIIWK